MPRRRRSQGQFVQIPEEYEDKPESWKRAFSHAASFKYNSVKACTNYAEGHYMDDEFADGDEAVPEENEEDEGATS